jgi:hypothetical protein
MPRPLRKTSATSLKLTPEVRDLWEQCAAAESRSLTNMFEVLVRDRAKSLNLQPRIAVAPAPTARKTATTKKSKR